MRTKPSTMDRMKAEPALIDAVRASYQRIGSPHKILLGLSGGADSLALLFVLMELRKHEGFELCCVHVNHHLREASDGEVEWLRKLLGELQIRLQVHDVRVPRGSSLEAQAREVRYAAFKEACDAAGASVLALGHHADDQAETMLMRLMHGTGPRGLSAMREFTGCLWRPLLQTSKERLTAYLRSLNQIWLEDASNQDAVFLRNAIRLRIMPEIERLSPGAAMRMAESARLFVEEDEAWAAMETKWLNDKASVKPPLVFLMTEPFLKEPLAFRRRLVRRLCRAYDIGLDRAQTEALSALPNMEKQGKINLPLGAHALRTSTRLHIVPAAYRASSIPALPRLKVVSPPQGFGDGKMTQTLDAEAASGAVLRFVKHGDIIRPLGMAGSQSMAQYLSDRKVDLPFRPYWPVLAKGNEVLWAIGLGAAQAAAVTDGTRNRIQFVFPGRLPGDLQYQTEED